MNRYKAGKYLIAILVCLMMLLLSGCSKDKSEDGYHEVMNNSIKDTKEDEKVPESVGSTMNNDETITQNNGDDSLTESGGVVNMSDQDVYKLTVNANTVLKIRDTYSTSGNHIGKLTAKTQILAYEKKSSGGYNWYMIGNNEWVPDDGTWLKVELYYGDSYYPYALDKEAFKIRTKTVLNIRSSTSTTSTLLGQLGKDSLISAYEKKVDGKYTWYRIGTNMWVPDDGSWIKEE